MSFLFNADEIFEIAIDIEENGKKFYEQAKEKIDDQRVKELFDYLANEETAHKERFAALKAELPDSAAQDNIYDPEGEMQQYLQMMADMHVFRSSKGVEEQVSKISSAADRCTTIASARRFGTRRTTSRTSSSGSWGAGTRPPSGRSRAGTPTP